MALRLWTPTDTSGPSRSRGGKRPESPVHDEDSESVQESVSLLGMNRSKKCDKSWISRLVVLLFCVLMLVALWSIVPIMSKAIQLEMKEWERMHELILLDIEKSREEKRVITDEIQLLQVEFREKKGAITEELQQLQAKRDDTRRKWENEREANEQRRHGHVPFWGEARLITTECPRDRFRQYDARMYNLLVEDDWYARCMNERIDIAGRTFASPHSCINHGLDDGVRGYWSFEVNTRECPRTIWDRLGNIFK